MMDITNENFMKCLPEITKTIQGCDFIAIDTELSGLMREQSLNRFDLPEERFSKSVNSSRGYFIMQFGLSCFTQTSHLQFTNRTYNFYIFPQPHKFHGDINRTFSLQAHAIQFLSGHGFDFNKLFKQGVSYLTFQEKKLLTARLKSDLKERSKVEFSVCGVPSFVPASMTLYCRGWITKLNTFAEERKKAAELKHVTTSSNSRMSISTNDSTEQDSEMADAAGPSSEDRFEIRDCSNSIYRRNLMTQVIESLPIADNLKIVQTTDPDKNETYLVIYYMDKKTKNEELRHDLILSKGFLEVIELIIVNKKPLVGHNLTLDLIQIINQFMEPLSDDYESFKETCHSLFPLIYDTKYIAHSILDPKTLTNNQSRLNDLYCQLKDHTNFPKIEIKHPGVFFDEKQLPHQAGYDAYMSGYSFVVLCEAYVKQNSGKKFKYDSADGNPVSLFSHRLIVDEFSNRIHLSYSYDFKFFDLARKEEEPDRANVFYMEFPSTWALNDIFQVFSPYGGVEAGRLSKTSALCALRDRSQTDTVRKMANNLSTTNYSIVTYKTYLEKYRSKRGRNAGCETDGDVTFSEA